MKKCIALLLSTLLLIAACGAIAETAETGTIVSNHYDFSTSAPENFGVIEDHREFNSLIIYVNDDTTAPVYTLSIAYSEIYDGMSLADCSDEEVALYKTLVGMNFNDAEITEAKTAMGTPLLIFNEKDSASDYVTIATIYKGYVLEMHIDKEDFSEITKEEVDMGVKIYSDISFLE